jgi:tRNA-dihydrouridine synthase A
MKNAGKQGLSVEGPAAVVHRRIAVAPMMDWTDRHCRFFLRGFSRRVLLHTEMLHANAILRGDRERLLRFHPEEHPVALQLGGSDPRALAAAARAGEEAGYDEINLNCGCPSDRVRSGEFGACLMRSPARVADAVAAMRMTVRVPVTVKMRIGTVEGRGAKALATVSRFDEQDRAALHDFVQRVRAVGCDVAIVHARKAVLGGLSPKDNREIPPLRYDVVRELAESSPGLPVVVNGGIRTVAQARQLLEWADGVMLGREAYHRPYVLAEIDRALDEAVSNVTIASPPQLSSQAPPPAASLPPPPSPRAILERMADYARTEMARGERLSSIARHTLGLASHTPGAKEYRRLMSECARSADADSSLFLRAADLLEGSQDSAAA